MAIVIGGKSKCLICGQTLETGQELVLFSPFVWNELDPLWKFSDAAMHETCFRSDALSQKAQERCDELWRHTPPHNYTCVVCGQAITQFDEYFSLGHLTENPADPLFAYNYTQAHRSHLPQWSELSHVLELLAALKASGTWRGRALDHWISELEEARRRVA